MATKVAGRNADIYVSTASISTAAPGNKLGVMRDWELTISHTPVDVTNFDSSSWREIISGIREVRGRCSHFLASSNAGHDDIYDALITNHAQINTWFRFTSAATPRLSGSIRITGLTHSGALEDAVGFGFEFQGSGAFTYSS